jgi:hypothetical protein
MQQSQHLRRELLRSVQEVEHMTAATIERFLVSCRLEYEVESGDWEE